MRGKIKIQIKNRHITFNFTLERNVTILTGTVALEKRNSSIW